MQSILVSAGLNLANNKLTQSSAVLAGGVQQIQFVNLSGNWSCDFSLTYTVLSFKEGKGNAKLGAMFMYNEQPGVVNGILNQQKSSV